MDFLVRPAKLVNTRRVVWIMFSFLKYFSSNHIPCPEPDKYGIPTWYKYLDGERNAAGECNLVFGDFDENRIQSLTVIGLAVVEILLYVSAIVAIAFVIYGGFQYLISQGEPDKTKSAKDTVLNAIIGLVIAVFATAIVRYIGRTVG